MSMAPNSANVPYTSPVPPPIQTTYRKVAQPSGEQAKQRKLISPATYKTEPTKAKQMARIMHAESRDGEIYPMRRLIL